MKRYITDDLYIPNNFNFQDVSKIYTELRHRILDKYGNRYKRLQVDFEDPQYQGTRISMRLIVHNGDNLLASKEFVFDAYDDYFEDIDYLSHLNRTIYQFVNTLLEH